MKRREFITLLGGAAAAWPLVARAQQPERLRRIGVLVASPADDAESQARVAAFKEGLAAIGLDRGTQCADRHPLGHDQCRRPSQTRGRIGCVDAGCPRRCQWHHNSGGIAAGDPYCADRVCDCGRPGRRRFRRELGAAGRQRDRVYNV